MVVETIVLVVVEAVVEVVIVWLAVDEIVAEFGDLAVEAVEAVEAVDNLEKLESSPIPLSNR